MNEILFIVYGGFFGFLASIVFLIWWFALYMAFGERRLPRGLRSSNPSMPMSVALVRTFKAMPLIALFHPFPWVIGLLLYGYFLVLTDQLDEQLKWMLLGFTGMLVAMIIYFLYIYRSGARQKQ